MKIMVNGLPGKMAGEVARHIVQSPDLALFPYSLTGQDVREDKTMIGNLEISLIKPDARNTFLFSDKPDIAVDFTHPSAVNQNTDFYCDNKLSFVMGTTGGDLKALEKRVQTSEVIALVSPNMAKQVVAFQAMVKYAADNFPNSFRGYSLQVTESHQKGKADTSGTARAIISYFNKLGIPFKPEQIVMIRDPEQQRALGIPESALAGHGWHTYTLKSQDGSVLFQFTHNVNGREAYAQGTLDAIRFLARKLATGEKGKVYSMIDVLKDVRQTSITT